MTENPLKPIALKKYIWKVLLLCAVTAAAAIVPFIIKGNGIFVLVDDFISQQIPFNMGTNTAIKDGSVFWNWSVDLGSNFIGAYSFYNLGSPFFWLSLLFSANAFPYVVGWIYILKYCVAGLTAFLYLKRFVKNPDIAVLGALLYAFSGFQTVNLIFYHFHDVVAFFPLMLIGLETLMEERSAGWFALSVAINALVNYYFFVGEVVFIVLYFCFRWLIFDFKRAYRRILQALLEAVIGVGIAAFLLLPSILFTLENPRVADSLTGRGLLFYESYRYVNLLKAVFMPASVMGDTLDYSSTCAYLPFIGIALTVGYILTKPKNWLSMLIIVCILLAGIPVLNSVFYALNGNYYARWFYMPVLMFILAAALSLDNISEYRKRTAFGFAAALAGAAGFIAAVSLTDGGREPKIWGRSVHMFSAYAALAAVGIIIAAILYYALKNPKRRVSAFILAVMVFSVLTTAVNIARQQDETQDAKYLYDTRVNGSRLLKLPDTDAYRIRIDWKYDNVAMINQIMSVNSFITTVNGSIFEFYGNIGCPRRIVTNCDNPAVDALLSVKYKMYSEAQGSEMPVLTYFDGSRTVYIYENKEVLPIGFTYEYYITKDAFVNLPIESRPLVLLQAVVVEAASDVDDRLSLIPEARLQNLDDLSLPALLAERRQETAEAFERDTRGFGAEISTEAETYAYFSVPYDKGWSATVNDTPVKIIDSNGMMLVPLAAGDNEIRFTYHTPGLTVGLIISGGSVIMLVLYWILSRRRRIKNAN